MKKLLLFIGFVVLTFAASAQCSMCSAVVESSQQSGHDLAQGLNAGILYLMAIPYALLVGMGILLFRKLNQNRVESE